MFCFLVALVVLPEGHMQESKDCLPFVEWNPPSSVILRNVANLVLHVLCPAMIVIRIGSFVHLFSPGISYFNKLDSILEFVEIEDCISMSRIEVTIVLFAACRGYRIVFLRVHLYNFFHEIGISRLDFTSWHSS